MRYGILVNFIDDDAPASTGLVAEYQRLADTRKRPTALARNISTTATPTIDRKRTLPDTPTWRLFSPRTPGTAFPTHTQPISDTVPRIKSRRIDKQQNDKARLQAVEKFAKPIRQEVDETMDLLAQLTVRPAKAPETEAVDSEVQWTLAEIHRMREDLEQKFIDEDEEKLRVIREAEEKARMEIEERERAERERLEAIEQAEREKVEAIERAKREREKQERMQRERQEAEEREQREREVKQREEAKKAREAAVSPAALAWADKYRGFYRVVQEQMKPRISNDRELKAWCFKQKGLIIRSVGQLTSTMAGVRQVSGKLLDIIAEAEQRGASDWVQNLVAKAIVKQAEAEVSAKMSAAYPLAAMAAAVINKVPGVLDMLFVRLVKKCPYVVPQYFSPALGREEFLRSAGYKERDDGVEPAAAYEGRMIGMVALFAALVQTPGTMLLELG
ncbi:Nuclear pore complex nucleoporin component, partial [Linderina pennispora]